ncbi:PPC domain-containing DNA-binding protein [Nocardia sputi]|uniref:PPC domain-containing DNA-binding protein n=1 Tax=Nocardia sputi TaxID=2943705 RepID=UPI0020BF8933|nr:PPC domain-containing DNA-binding protein [Nocardia sputi]
MRAHELGLGRTFGLVFDHGDDFHTALDEFCRTHHIRQGYIPSFIAGFSEVDLVGTCDRLDDPAAPVWSKVHLRNVEAFGGGTLAYDPDTGRIKPHIHVAIGLKEHAATGYTSHLLDATVQFLTEMLVIEVLTPDMTRTPQPDLYNVPLLRFGPTPGHGTAEPS